MKFAEGNNPCGSLRKKKNKSSCQRDNELHHRLKSTAAANEPLGLHIQKLGPICKSRKIGDTIISHQSLVEDDLDLDLDQQLGVERCSDNNECMWLSSDCLSPSVFFQEYRLSGPFHEYADDWLISWLSTLANSYLRLDKGSTLSNELRINSVKHSSLNPEKINPDAKENTQEDMKGKAGITLLLNSPGTDEMDEMDSLVTSSESVKSQGIDHDSSSSSSVITDTERSGFCESLVNLDEEDSNWISDTESVFEQFQLSGFLSPSDGRSWSYEVKSSNSSPPVPTEVKKSNPRLSFEPESEAEDLKDLRADEPLFWPFEDKQDWSSEESWKRFSMSPRRGSISVQTPEGNSVGSSTGPQIRVRKTNSKIVCRRKPVTSSGSPASRMLELKQRNNNKDVKKISNTPSRLRNKVSMKVTPIDTENYHKLEQKDTKFLQQNPCVDRNLFQGDVALNKELPIDSIFGLGEFDGHEG